MYYFIIWADFVTLQFVMKISSRTILIESSVTIRSRKQVACLNEPNCYIFEQISAFHGRKLILKETFSSRRKLQRLSFAFSEDMNVAG